RLRQRRQLVPNRCRCRSLTTPGLHVTLERREVDTGRLHVVPEVLVEVRGRLPYPRPAPGAVLVELTKPVQQLTHGDSTGPGHEARALLLRLEPGAEHLVG